MRKDVQGARLVDQFDCRRSERADIMATTRMHKLVLVLLFTAITELVPSVFREVATSHGMVKKLNRAGGSRNSKGVKCAAASENGAERSRTPCTDEY
jgi:hypothetical protein